MLREAEKIKDGKKFKCQSEKGNFSAWVSSFKYLLKTTFHHPFYV